MTARDLFGVIVRTGGSISIVFAIFGMWELLKRTLGLPSNNADIPTERLLRSIGFYMVFGLLVLVGANHRGDLGTGALGRGHRPWAVSSS